MLLSWRRYRQGVIRTPARLALLGLAVAASLTACSNTQSAANREPYTGSTTAAAGPGVEAVTLTVDASFRFSPSTVTVHPGRVRLTLQHIGTGAPHDWQVVGIPGDYIAPIGPGQSGSLTFTAPAPGKYTFVCTIHERQGQNGTLIVLPS